MELRVVGGWSGLVQTARGVELIDRTAFNKMQLVHLKDYFEPYRGVHWQVVNLIRCYLKGESTTGLVWSCMYWDTLTSETQSIRLISPMTDRKEALMSRRNTNMSEIRLSILEISIEANFLSLSLSWCNCKKCNSFIELETPLKAALSYRTSVEDCGYSLH